MSGVLDIMDRLTTHLRSVRCLRCAITKSNLFYGDKLTGLSPEDRAGVVEYCESHGYGAEFVADQLGGECLRIEKRGSGDRGIKGPERPRSPDPLAPDLLEGTQQYMSGLAVDRKTHGLIHG